LRILRVRIVGKRKVEAIEKIKKKLIEHKEPKIGYTNVDKALSHIEFSFNHLNKGEKNLSGILPKIIDKIKSEIGKLLLVKSNVKLGLGVDATWAKPILKDPF
jgi:hypothetical protein